MNGCLLRSSALIKCRYLRAVSNGKILKDLYGFLGRAGIFIRLSLCCIIIKFIFNIIQFFCLQSINFLYHYYYHYYIMMQFKNHKISSLVYIFGIYIFNTFFMKSSFIIGYFFDISFAYFTNLKLNLQNL